MGGRGLVARSPRELLRGAQVLAGAPLRPSRTTVGCEKSLRRKAAVFVAWVGWRGTVLTCCSGRKLESESTFLARPRAGGLRLPAL